MIAFVLVRAFASVLVLSPSAQANAQQVCPGPRTVFDYDDPAVATNDRRLWAEADRILRLPDKAQALEIAHVYRDILSVLHPRMYPLANWHLAPPGRLNDLKSRPRRSVSGPYNSMYAQQVSLAMLAAHPTEAQPLIQIDLTSSNPETLERGLFVARHMTEARFPDLYDDLKRVFLSDRECSDTALGSLLNYAGLPRVSSADERRGRVHELTPVLAARFQRDPGRYASYLGTLLAVGPAPAQVLTALQSDDATVRQYASHAVIASTDPRLAPYVRRMLADANPYVRLNGFSIGFRGVRRRDAAYNDIKPALDTLMRDPDWRVRLDVLETFAFAGDQACVPVLFDLLSMWAAGDRTIPDEDFRQVAILVESITRQTFGFGDGKLPARQDPANRLAIGKFSNWVKAQKH